ncbi:MAG: hypothetical protein MUD10_01565 [Candidatus Pacebacteria bacterium]|nr:hypothetical protein [Candidatus Paceibacterota bacterium]
MDSRGGKTGGGGLGEMSTEDLIAAFKAAMSANFRDQTFLDALFNFMLGDPVKYESTVPTFQEFAQAILTELGTRNLSDSQKVDLENAKKDSTSKGSKAEIDNANNEFTKAAKDQQAEVKKQTQESTLVGDADDDQLDSFAESYFKGNGGSVDKAEFLESIESMGGKWNGAAIVDKDGNVAEIATEVYQGKLSLSNDDPACAALDALNGVGWLSDGQGATGGGGGGGSGGSGGSEAAAPADPGVTSETNATQTTAQVSLSVSTKRTANCQYSTTAGFVYGNGTAFSTTGQYNHNTSVDGTKHPYYVACKDVDTAGVSAAIKIDFTLDLSQDPNNQPKINVTTPATQTDANPKLSLTTDRNAACKYNKDVTFTYATGGTTMTVDTARRAFEVALAAYADGDYTFYVACRDDSTGAVSEVKTITTKLNRNNSGNAPVITDKTAKYQNMASTTIEIETKRNSICKYRENNDFNFDDNNGTVFSTDSGATGVTVHKSALTGLSGGNHKFYVVCKDVATGATNATGTEIIFTVSNGAPEVTSTTPAAQTGSDPKLSVTTNMKAVCKYNKGATFDYATAGTEMAATENWQSHSVSLVSLSDGAYDFYVICRDYLSTASFSEARKVSTSINRSAIDTDGPEVKNATAGFQTVNNPKLMVTTDKDSNCKYGTNDFDYASGGTLFVQTGETTHSVELSNLANGQHAYYVVCQRISNNVTSPKGYQIIFTTDTSGDANVCNNLSSNDRKNDGNRSYASDSEGDSVYPWQSVETGTREKFAKVDWFAGYQFTPTKDGQVTQLCGFFDSGTNNEVSLFNGSYKELAKTKVAGNGKWKCVDVTPAEIKADGRYYVVTYIDNGPIYYEYKSGLFPIESNDIVIEAGIRQTIIDDESMTSIIKYDYMIFGLVDIKVSYVPTSTAGPEVTGVGPKGMVYNTSTAITALTADNASCRFDREDVDYSQMAYNLPWVASGSYSQKICGLEDGDYTFYVRCKDASGKTNNGSKMVKFKIEK